MEFSFGKEGCKVYDFDSVELFMSTDVIFYEEIIPYKITNKPCEYHMQDVGIFDIEYPTTGGELCR